MGRVTDTVFPSPGFQKTGNKKSDCRTIPTAANGNKGSQSVFYSKHLLGRIIKYKKEVCQGNNALYTCFQVLDMTVTNIRDILADNMKAFRNARGFTQAKLAEKINTSTHYIGMIETKNKFPSPEMIERIAIALEIDTLDLFTLDKKKPETIKAYQKSTIKQVKSLVSHFLDERLKELEKKP